MKNKISKYRKQVGMSQNQLGEVLGCSGGCISNYESGYRLPDIPTITKLLAVFRGNGIKTDFDDLFSEDETTEESVA